jgi:hypothetical protein
MWLPRREFPAKSEALYPIGRPEPTRSHVADSLIITKDSSISQRVARINRQIFCKSEQRITRQRFLQEYFQQIITTEPISPIEDPFMPSISLETVRDWALQ